MKRFPINKGIVKEIIDSGDPCLIAPIFSERSKVKFHYKAFLITNKGRGEEIGHSNKDQPFELILSKGFSLQAWEIAIRTMKIGEKSLFFCDSEYSKPYLELESIVRSSRFGRTRCCAGDENQDFVIELLKYEGCCFEFELTLLSVEGSGSFKKNLYEMDVLEQFNEARDKNELGKEKFKNSKFLESKKLYREALGIFESLSCNQVICDLEDEILKVSDLGNDIKKTLSLDNITRFRNKSRLNYAICCLKTTDYKETIEMCNRIIKEEPGNVKAIFLRGKAHLLIGRDLEDSEQDLDYVEKCLPGLEEIQTLRNLLKEKKSQQLQNEHKMFGNIFHE
jgi:AH receptor-interacting protein